MSTDNTSLIARANLKEAEAAITEFDRVQAGIADLKTKYKGVIFPVATTAGMRDAVAARAAVLYLESDVARICSVLIRHLTTVARGEIKEAA